MNAAEPVRAVYRTLRVDADAHGRRVYDSLFQTVI